MSTPAAPTRREFLVAAAVTSAASASAHGVARNVDDVMLWRQAELHILLSELRYPPLRYSPFCLERQGLRQRGESGPRPSGFAKDAPTEAGGAIYFCITAAVSQLGHPACHDHTSQEASSRPCSPCTGAHIRRR